MIGLDVPRLGVAILIFLINLPFGYYRVRFRRFSRPWGRTIYLPILINVLTRRFILHWDWTAIPYLFTGTILGHLLGGLSGVGNGKGEVPPRRQRSVKRNVR